MKVWTDEMVSGLDLMDVDWDMHLRNLSRSSVEVEMLYVYITDGSNTETKIFNSIDNALGEAKDWLERGFEVKLCWEKKDAPDTTT